MRSKLWLCFFAVLLMPLLLWAQSVGDILWQDNFNDEDSLARYEVGWFYYDESDNLMGAVVEQREGALYFKQGSFGILAAVVAGTNGVPALETDENDELTEDTKQDLISNDFSSPNQEGTFQVNFKNITSSWFIVPTRMLQDDDLTDSDPRETPSYLIFISPLQGTVGLAKSLEEQYAMLDPTLYDWLTDFAAFPFELDVFYWVKWYLYEGIYKVKIWSGELSDEPDAWLIEAEDPEPRVTGMFTYFGLLSDEPTATDEILIDNIVLREVKEGSAVRATGDVSPVSFRLRQNYPNPFNPSTEIVYTLARAGDVTLTIYNQAGRLIREFSYAQQQAGEHVVLWNGADAAGGAQSSGLYYARLSCDGLAQTIKMVLLR
ncbi:T9SS type A sorting domain-containing protein [candidate division KSB1 bacterium]|nr:T9SS type A sorting domain-containing protein [candidate division KSB1 bacterium]